MRTCPACGEDTEAQTTEPCTECGFSPVAQDPATIEAAPTPPEEDRWGSQPPPASPPPEAAGPPGAPSTPPPGAPPPASTDQQPQYGFPDEPAEPAEAQKRRPRVAPIWIVLILIGIAWQAFNISDGCGDILSSSPGPTASETEDALVADAEAQGVQGPSADCPDSAQDTEVGNTFNCTMTNAAGAEAPITVTNLEESFEWSRASFLPLLPTGAGEQQPGPEPN
jgi:hypothetical protein